MLASKFLKCKKILLDEFQYIDNNYGFIRSKFSKNYVSENVITSKSRWLENDIFLMRYLLIFNYSPCKDIFII